MRFFDEIRDSDGYYYIHDKLNLNDFVLMIAYVMLMFALWVVYLVYPDENDFESFDMILQLLAVGFSIPFVAHFTDRAVKFLSFKLKKNKILKNGMPYRAEVIDSKKGKVLFKDSVTNIKKYSYYPVIKAYVSGSEHIFTSKIPVSNSHTMGLKDKNVIVYIYKDDFVLVELSVADEGVLNLEYINSQNKSLYNLCKKIDYMWMVVTAAGIAIVQVVTMTLRLIIKYWIN